VTSGRGAAVGFAFECFPPLQHYKPFSQSIRTYARWAGLSFAVLLSVDATYDAKRKHTHSVLLFHPSFAVCQLFFHFHSLFALQLFN